MPPEIPDKVYFKISEVAELVGVEPYVLRYWETEFPQLRPTRAPSQQRLYRREDLEILLEIKRLLYEEKFTIAGAKKQIRSSGKDTEQVSREEEYSELIRALRESLTEIKRLLEDK